MNKKGLSDVITTVLIILLVLAAIALIWAAITNPIKSGSKQIQDTSACYQVEMSVKSCSYIYNASTQSAKIAVQWSGGNAAKLSKLMVLVSDKDGVVAANDTVAAPTFLNSVVANVNIATLGNASTPYIASVAPVLVDASTGADNNCPEQQSKYTCAKAS